jgi:hypothetical protein
MSRSGYSDDYDNDWASICWRGAVASAIRGNRGQAFLEEMLHAMAALPERKLISHDLEKDGAVCAIGAVGKARGIDMKGLDPEDRDTVAKVFGIAPALAAEIVYMNDEATWHLETPEQRFERMRSWIEEQLIDQAQS